MNVMQENDFLNKKFVAIRDMNFKAIHAKTGDIFKIASITSKKYPFGTGLYTLLRKDEEPIMKQEYFLNINQIEIILTGNCLKSVQELRIQRIKKILVK